MLVLQLTHAEALALEILVRHGYEQRNRVLSAGRHDAARQGFTKLLEALEESEKDVEETPS